MKQKVNGENPQEKFKRLAEARTKAILSKLRVLGNCSNRQIYAYTQKDIDIIFNAIEKEIKRIKAKFSKPAEEGFSLSKK